MTVLINYQDQKTEIKAIPFKISNESLHVIGQQPNHIENTVSIKKSASEKSVLIEKPLLDLSSQGEKVLLKTSQSKMLEVVDKMLSDLKIKIEGTSRSTTCAISKIEKEIVSDKHTDSDTVPSVLAKEILMMNYQKLKDLLKIPNPCLLHKIGILDLFLLIYNLKKGFFNHNFLFLLSFTNGILLNKKS